MIGAGRFERLAEYSSELSRFVPKRILFRAASQSGLVQDVEPVLRFIRFLENYSKSCDPFGARSRPAGGVIIRRDTRAGPKQLSSDLLRLGCTRQSPEVVDHPDREPLDARPQFS